MLEDVGDASVGIHGYGVLELAVYLIGGTSANRRTTGVSSVGRQPLSLSLLMHPVAGGLADGRARARRGRRAASGLAARGERIGGALARAWRGRARAGGRGVRMRGRAGGRARARAAGGARSRAGGHARARGARAWQSGAG